MDNINTFGERLAKCRAKIGLSQAELSEQLQLSKSALAMYETNKREPNLAIINQLSERLGVSTDYLISGKEMDIQKLLSNHWGAIPHVKEITSEGPIIKQDNIDTYFSTPFSWLDGHSDYIWYTPGSEDYIRTLTGMDPWVLISLQTKVENGDLAAVCLKGGNVVLRRIYYHDQAVMLVPNNPEKHTPPAIYKEGEIIIRGKVIALIKAKFFV